MNATVTFGPLPLVAQQGVPTGLGEQQKQRVAQEHGGRAVSGDQHRKSEGGDRLLAEGASLRFVDDSAQYVVAGVAALLIGAAVAHVSFVGFGVGSKIATSSETALSSWVVSTMK